MKMFFEECKRAKVKLAEYCSVLGSDELDIGAFY